MTYQLRYATALPNGNKGVGLVLNQAVAFVANLPVVLGLPPGHGNALNAPPAASTAERLVQANTLLDSRAYRETWVRGLYRSLLGREADAQGLQAHLARLGRGTTMAELVASFVASGEFLNRNGGTAESYVNALYQTLLGRQPAGGEGQPHLARLRSGTSRLELARSFLQSGEFARREALVLFRGILGREPGEGELAAWTTTLSGQRDPVRAGLASFLSSLEAFIRLAGTAPGPNPPATGNPPTWLLPGAGNPA
jgi:hypothetical protein